MADNHRSILFDLNVPPPLVEEGNGGDHQDSSAAEAPVQAVINSGGGDVDKASEATQDPQPQDGDHGGIWGSPPRKRRTPQEDHEDVDGSQSLKPNDGDGTETGTQGDKIEKRVKQGKRAHTVALDQKYKESAATGPENPEKKAEPAMGDVPPPVSEEKVDSGFEGLKNASEEGSKDAAMAPEVPAANETAIAATAAVSPAAVVRRKSERLTSPPLKLVDMVVWEPRRRQSLTSSPGIQTPRGPKKSKKTSQKLV